MHSNAFTLNMKNSAKSNEHNLEEDNLLLLLKKKVDRYRRGGEKTERQNEIQFKINRLNAKSFGLHHKLLGFNEIKWGVNRYKFNMYITIKLHFNAIEIF